MVFYIIVSSIHDVLHFKLESTINFDTFRRVVCRFHKMTELAAYFI
jgi:hypothetical protein